MKLKQLSLFSIGTMWQAGKSGGGPPHSKTLRAGDCVGVARSVLECSSPLELCMANQKM
jgi:hypothetical protein